MRDGDGDGKCREQGDKWVPCPPGVPAGTLLGRLTETIDQLDGIDLDPFRMSSDEEDDEAAYTLEKQARFDSWQQWAECRAIRRKAYEIVSGRESPADPYLRRTEPNFFGDPKTPRSVDMEQAGYEARYLLNQLAWLAQRGMHDMTHPGAVEVDADRRLYRAVQLPEDDAAFMEAFAEGKIVDIPLMATANSHRVGTSDFLTRYGSDVLLEIQGPTVGLTSGAIITLVDDEQEEETLQQIQAMLDDFENYSDDDDNVFAEELQDLLDRYIQAKEDDDVTKMRSLVKALKISLEEMGWSDLPFAGDDLSENDPSFYERIEDYNSLGQREVITGGRFRVVKVMDDPDGVYKTRIVLDHVGVFDPRVPGALIPVQRAETA